VHNLVTKNFIKNLTIFLFFDFSVLPTSPTVQAYPQQHIPALLIVLVIIGAIIAAIVVFFVAIRIRSHYFRKGKLFQCCCWKQIVL